MVKWLLNLTNSNNNNTYYGHILEDTKLSECEQSSVIYASTIYYYL